MKKFFKILLVIIMLIGVFVSIANFMSVEINAVVKPIRGVWSDGVCVGDGSICDMNFPK